MYITPEIELVEYGEDIIVTSSDSGELIPVDNGDGQTENWGALWG